MAEQSIALRMNLAPKFLSISHAKREIGGFSTASKLPCWTYSLPAENCKTGMKLHKIKGTICEDCYACKSKSGQSGFYTTSRVLVPMRNRLKQVLENPRWKDAMIFLFQHYKWPFFRWHDSGDIQGLGHFEKICEIADAVPDTMFWLPTQERKIIIQYWLNNGKIPLKELHPNLAIRLSAIMKNGVEPIELAKKLGVTCSRTSSDESEVDCPAHSQGDFCGECRSCWNNDKMSVTYRLHILGTGHFRSNPLADKITSYIDENLISIGNKTCLYKSGAKHFGVPEIKIRIYTNLLKRKYKKRLAILDGTYVERRGRPFSTR
jgi:hypothetical protein